MEGRAESGTDDEKNVARPLTSDNIRSFVDSVDAFLFDCDGLIYTRLFRFIFFIGLFKCFLSDYVVLVRCDMEGK